MSRRGAWTRHLRKAKPVTFDGYAFATANEAGQYRSLRDREERGEVRALQFTSEPTRLRVRYQVRDRDGSYLDAADAFTLAAPRKPAKYRNVKTEVDGIRFDSKREAACYRRLKLLERADKINALELQVRFPLTIRGQLVTTYVADFRYQERRDHGQWQDVVADAKGHRTREYLIKKKLMKAIHGIEIMEM
jgi:hypothetical protein